VEEIIPMKHRNLSNNCVNYPRKISCFLEDLFLGGQSSIIYLIDGYLLNLFLIMKITVIRYQWFTLIGSPTTR